MSAEPHVLVAEFRTANEEQAAKLWARLQALAEEIGAELASGGWVTADAYDADEAALEPADG